MESNHAATEHSAPTLERSRSSASLGQMLMDIGRLSYEQVMQAQDTARRERLSLGRVLGRDGLVLPRDLAALMALHMGLTMLDLGSQTLDPDVVSLLPEEVARKYMALPVNHEEGV